MNKTLYRIIGCVPFLGPIIQTKSNFFSLKCSPFMADFMGTNEYKVLRNWQTSHPNQILSPKIAKKLLKK